MRIHAQSRPVSRCKNPFHRSPVTGSDKKCHHITQRHNPQQQLPPLLQMPPLLENLDYNRNNPLPSHCQVIAVDVGNEGDPAAKEYPTGVTSDKKNQSVTRSGTAVRIER